jgi:hypothetical protein
MNDDLQNKPEQKQGLKAEVEQLRETLERVNTVSTKFFLGIASGVGATVGATIVAAILLYILSRVFEGTQLEMFIPQETIPEPTNME